MTTTTITDDRPRIHHGCISLDHMLQLIELVRVEKRRGDPMRRLQDLVLDLRLLDAMGPKR